MSKSILLCLLFSLFVATSLACKCLRGVPLEDKVQNAKSVFRGTIVGKQEVEESVFYLVRVLDACRLNGEPTPGPEPDLHVTVRSGKHSCGVLHLQKDETFTFLAGENNEIHQCSWEGAQPWSKVRSVCEQKEEPEDQPDEDEPEEPEELTELRALGRYPRPVHPHHCPVLKHVTHEVCSLCRRLRRHKHHRRGRREERHHRRRRHHRRHHPRREDNGEEEPPRVFPSHILVDPPQGTPVQTDPNTPVQNDDGCEKTYSPVCANGITYANECEAKRAGAFILHAGECAPVTQESLNIRVAPVPRPAIHLVAAPAQEIAQNNAQE